jgi:hypothetical protein
VSGRAEANGHGELLDGGRLVVVRVTDTVAATLAGREGRTYESPPQPRQQALALVELLLGRPAEPVGRRPVSYAVAGGRRTVTLTFAGEESGTTTGEG